MASPLEDTSFNMFPPQSPPNSPLTGSGFLPNRPVSAGIDSIKQGFRFTAPGRKPAALTARAGFCEGTSRGRVVGNDVGAAGSNSGMVGPGLSGVDVLKLSAPIFAPTPPSPPIPAVTIAPFVIREEQMMLPPAQSPRLSDRGRSNTITKEKRKRIDSSVISDTESRTQSGSVLVQASSGEPRRLEGSRTRDTSTGEGVAKNRDRRIKASGAGTLGDERNPKKRLNKPVGPYRHSIAPAFIAPPIGDKETEVIVLDDDIKAEPGEVHTSRTASEGNTLSGDHTMGIGKPERYSGSYQRHEKIKVYANQPMRHYALEPKDDNQRIGAKLGMPIERAHPSSFEPGAGMRKNNSQSARSNRSSVGSSVILRTKRSRNSGHVMEPPSQKIGSSTALSSHIIPMPEGGHEQNTGEYKLLVALTTLTTEKQALETRLHEITASLKAQYFLVEASERKNAELEAQSKAHRDTLHGLKKKMLGVQKFVDGLGKDYNMLNEKKLQLDKRLDEVSRDRNELLRSLQEVKGLAKKTDGTIQAWGSSGTMLKEAYREIDKLNETLKFLHAQLSEKAGLLAAERDRTQSLEVQIQDDREKTKSVLAAIQDGKTELAEQLTEIREAIEEKSDLDLMDKLAEAKKSIEAMTEVDGEATRNLVHRCFKIVEKLRDREVDAAECLLGAEKRINHTSDSIMGLFQETHQMNTESLSYIDGYISHLNSRIMDLEEESNEMQEKYEALLVDSVEKKQLGKDLEQRLKASLEKCDEISGRVEKGKATESLLEQSISILKQKVAILETQPTEDLTTVETIKALKQKNYELEKECELARNNAQDATSSLQLKCSELENLGIELGVLLIKHKEVEERIKGFENERADFMARAEEQKMKERIEVETSANMFRQRETSRLNNQIKALEGQKEKLEAENRNAAIEKSNQVLDSRNEIAELQAKYTDIERSHMGLLQENIRLENIVKQLTQLEVTARTSYPVLERLAETTANELSKALEQINILQGDKHLMSQEIRTKEQELERLRSEQYELRTTIENATALRIAERNLREALKEAEDENKALKGGDDKKLGDRNSGTMANSYEELEPSKRDIEKVRETIKETIAESSRKLDTIPPGKLAMERFANSTDTEETVQEITIGAENLVSWDINSPSLSPFTPPELILETQMDENRTDEALRSEGEMWSSYSRIDDANFERYLFGDDDGVNVEDLAKDVLGHPRVENGTEKSPPSVSHASTSRVKGIKKDSQDSQPRKNMATKFTSQRRLPSMMLDDDDEATMIDDFSDDAETKVAGVLLLSNTYPRQTDPTYLTPRPRTMEDKENKNRKTIAERYSFIPATASSNKPKTPQRTDDSRGGIADDGRRSQQRARKEHGKKNRGDQEWVEEEGELPRNSKGKEETPNMKKNLRNYKERKKGGKKFA